MKLKDKVIKQIPKILSSVEEDIDFYDGIDERLTEYILDNLKYTTEHNAYEILSVIRFIKLTDKYNFNKTKFKRFVKFYEMLQFPSENGQMSFKLTPVQIFQFANIFGLYKDDGYRLCNEALLYVPRKFSKTTSVAAAAIYDLMFGPADAQAYVASNSFNQSQICFKIISNTLRPLDPKMQTFRRNRDIIYSKIPGKTSFIQCLSSSPDRLDGLAASTIILDEYAASTSAALKNVLTSSQGIRKEPLTIIITTASTNLDTPFQTDLANYKKILEGEIEDDSVFASIFEPDEDDSFEDEATWKKVQPHMGVTVTLDFYRRSWAKACRSADDMTEFRTKLLNVFTLPVDKEWIKQKVVQQNMISLQLNQITTRPYCMVGIDLSVKDDMSAVSYGLYDTVAKTYTFYTDYYIPKETLYTHQNSQMYMQWAQQGYLKICGDDVIDYQKIGQDIINNSKYVNILSIGYDAYRNLECTNYLRAQGVKNLKSFKQTYASFTSPVEAFEQGIYEGRIKIADNPITTWMIDNVAIDTDNLKNKKPIKKTHAKKVDGVITMLMALGQFMTWRR